MILNDRELTQIRGQTPLIRDAQRMRFKRDKPFTFERNRSLTITQTSTVVEYTQALDFKLTDFPGNGNLTAFFDQFRILQAIVTLLPIAQTNATPLLSVIDLDDNTASPVSDLQEYSSLMVTQPGVTHERVFTPRAAVAAYSGSAFTSYAQAPPGMWFDLDSSGIPHYGLKLAMPVLPSSGVSTYSVSVKLVIQCRGSK